MPQVATDALVLHVFDYLETSRILRLVTREFGVLSVVARGARKSSNRFGSALDLFAEGSAQIELRPGRDLQTLTSFDVRSGRPALARELSRFTAAAALSECVQRLVADDQAPAVYEIVRAALDTLCVAEADAVVSVGLGALWRIVTELGVAPELTACAVCHMPLPPSSPTAFSHAAGGLLCPRCAARTPNARQMPVVALVALRAWMSGQPSGALPVAEGRAHQRLLREFIGQHLTDPRALKAYTVWESGTWV